MQEVVIAEQGLGCAHSCMQPMATHTGASPRVRVKIKIRHWARKQLGHINGFHKKNQGRGKHGTVCDRVTV